MKSINDRLKLTRFLWLASLCATLFEPTRTTAGTHTWTGTGGNGLWSTAGNWTGGAPAAGEVEARLIFPSAALIRLSSTNNIDNLQLSSITLAGTGYRLYGTGLGTNLTLTSGIYSSGASNFIGSSLDLVLGTRAGAVSFEATDLQDVLRIEGGLSGPGGLTVLGSGSVILAGGVHNTYRGLTRIDGGGGLFLAQSRFFLFPVPTRINYTAIPGDVEATLGAIILDADDQIADASNILIQRGALNLNAHHDEVRSLRGGGNLTTDDPLTQVNNDNGFLILNQQASSASDPNAFRTNAGPLWQAPGFNQGRIFKRGSGEWRLDPISFAVTWPPFLASGTVYIEDGTVHLASGRTNVAFSLRSPTAVLATSTPTNDFTVANGIEVRQGELRPAATGPGTPLQTGKLLLASGARLRVVLRSPTEYSRISVHPGIHSFGLLGGGALQVELGNATLDATSEFIPDLNQKFTIIAMAGTNAVSGHFLDLPEGSSFMVGGQLFRISYQGGDGNDVELTRVVSLAEHPPVLDPPQFGYDVTGVPQILLQLTTLANQPLKIETNSNLSNPAGWGVLANTTADDAGRVIHTDRVASGSPRNFYRANATLAPLPSGPWTIPTSQLPLNLVAAAVEHLRNFGDDDEGTNGWSDAVIAPTAIQLHDPAHLRGGAPAYAELKITGPATAAAGRPGEDRGHILLSLTPGDWPIAEFSTQGPTEAESLLRLVQGTVPTRLMRFGSGFVVAEGADGQRLGSIGTPPRLPVGPVPTNAVRYVHSYDSETGITIRPTNPPPVLRIASNYGELRTDWGTNPVIAAAREAHAQRVQPAWRRVNGLLPPAIRVRVGETNRFALNEFFASIVLDIDSDETPAALVRPVPNATGFEVVGIVPCVDILRGVTKGGQVIEYVLTVASPAAAPLLQAASGSCVVYDRDEWVAGQGWHYDQPHYYQYEHPSWCDYTGCGPVALSMLAAWWDKHGVPSAFYKLTTATVGEVNDFRFSFDSLATQDAPMDLGETEVFRNYGDFHDLCNVTCEVISGAGSTLPADLPGAWEDYLNRVTEPWPSPQDEFGQQFVGANWYASWNYPFTDWEGGGTAVAIGIKHGRPGVVGIGWGGKEHYVLAYAYRRTRRYEGCGSNQELTNTDRYFKCNMGWETKRKWKHAEDVWLGLTAQLWQKHLP